MKRSRSKNNAKRGPCFGFLMMTFSAFLLPLSTVGQPCVDDFQQIYEKESQVNDTSQSRSYVVCPRKIYEMGNLDYDGNLVQPNVGTVNPPLPLRNNIRIRCGDRGSRQDLCWLRGGDLHMDGTKALGIKDETLENVQIEGFVFMGAREHSLLANKPGSITFRDCEFRDFTNSSAPIMLDYFDASNPTKELVTSFFECDFRNNRYFGMGSQNALIYGNSDQNRIVMEGTVFENNDMVWNNTRPSTHSYIVESLGPVIMQKTCFKDNLVGSSDVVVFGSTFENSMNFVSNSSGSLCQFSSVFETIEQFNSFKPTCIESTSKDCDRLIISSPTALPSSKPIALPSGSPKPTSTPMPTPQHLSSSSGKPSNYGTTKAPTNTPSKVPLDVFGPTIVTEVPSVAAASCRTSTIVQMLLSAGLACLLG